MFALAQAAWTSLFERQERKLILLGLDSAGKTTLLNSTKLLFAAGPTQQPLPISPTVGLNVARLLVPNPPGAVQLAQPNSVLLWDLGGAEPLRPIWDRYIDEADGLIWVVDASAEDRLAESRTVLEQVLSRAGTEGKPLLVWANKYDEDGCVDPIRVSAMVNKMEDQRGILVMRASGKTGSGVKSGITWLVARVARRAEELASQQTEDSPDDKPT